LAGVRDGVSSVGAGSDRFWKYLLISGIPWLSIRNWVYDISIGTSLFEPQYLRKLWFACQVWKKIILPFLYWFFHSFFCLYHHKLLRRNQ
jgi:hypothetical protein